MSTLCVQAAQLAVQLEHADKLESFDNGVPVMIRAHECGRWCVLDRDSRAKPSLH